MESDGFAEEAEDVAASGPPSLAIREIRGVAVPGTQTGAFLDGTEAGRGVLVAEGHEVWSDDVVVGGFEAGGGEGAWDEFTGGRIRGMGWLMGMEGPAVVFGRAKLVSGEVVSDVDGGEGKRKYYLLRGSCHFLSFAFATGS